MTGIETFKFTLLFFAISFGGVFLEVFLFKMFHREGKNGKMNVFSYSKYLLMLIPPFLGLVILTAKVGPDPLKMFLISVVIGPILEWFIGYFYHLFSGERLWTYHKLSISGYTSWLSLPFWGNAGVLFWLLAKELIN